MAYALDINNLSVKLGSHPALEDISFTAEHGDFVTILGPNGSGKTTILKSILGLIHDYEGEIKVFGKDIRKSRPEEIGYVPQLKTLNREFPATTCDLVASGLHRRWPGRMSKKDHDLVNDLLSHVGADHLCHKQLGHLSGGEIQRVYLARAIVRRPRLLLLDEPATGIDHVGEDDMYSILDEYHSKVDVTILMVTHDWMAAQHHATKALLINRKMISFGPPDESLTDDNLRTAFGHLGHHHMMGGPDA
jgi:zinc transport system ATP-binding protein